MFIIFQNAKENDFRTVDLHHLYKDEAEELLFLIIECIKNGHLANRKGAFELSIITGRGVHSKNGAVLMPHVVGFLKQQGYVLSLAKEGCVVCNVRQ